MDPEGARKGLERKENGKQVEQAQSIVKAQAANQANSKENGQIDFDILDIALSSDVKYCGGAKTSSDKTAHGIVLPSYEGLRLYNPGNNCYIHAALNSLVTNPYIMTEMNNAFQHPGMPSFFQEIENLVVCREDILNVIALKTQLYNHFPNTLPYNSNDQEDAAVPFFLTLLIAFLSWRKSLESK